MSLLDELKKEAEQVAKNTAYDPTPEDIVEASEEVKEEQQAAIEEKAAKKVIQTVPDAPSTTKLQLKRSDMDMLKRQMMSKDVPGYGMMFGTDPENLPSMSRMNRLEAAGFATIKSQAAVITHKLKPGQSFIEYWMDTYLLNLQGVDGQGREDFKLMKQFEQEETKGNGMQG